MAGLAEISFSSSPEARKQFRGGGGRVAKNAAERRPTQDLQRYGQLHLLLHVLVVGELALVLARVRDARRRQLEDPDRRVALVDGGEAVVLRVDNVADGQDL